MSMSLSRTAFTIAACLFAAASIVACHTDTLVDVSGGVAGIVCNPQTGRPAVSATVTANFVTPRTNKAGSKNATTDANGFFKLGGLPTEKVNLHVVPELGVLMVKTSCVELTEVMAALAPLVALLIAICVLLVALIFSILTVGGVPPVSKTKPAGAFRMMVPFPAWPEAVSV